MYAAVLAQSFTETFQKFALETGLLEWAGVFTGILCVWLAARNIIWNWPVAIVSVIIYIFIFYETRLYADMGLQFYFLMMNIYGWYYWSRRVDTGEQPITSMGKNQWLFSAAATIVFTLALGTLLYRHTDASFPYLDSFCTAVSFVAQIFLARRAMQNWLIWIFVDLIYIGLYVSKGLYPTAFMYALYVYIAARGYIEWRKIYLEQREQAH